MSDLSQTRRRIIVGMTGASGAAIGIRALEILKDHSDIETHLIVTRSGRSTIHEETDLSVQDVKDLADVVHSDNDLGSSLASGSFLTAGMLIAPCSIKTLSGVANSYDETLLVRAADVVLKERRRLVMLLRETPLHLGHLRLMTQVTESGAIVMPPVPAFYTRAETVAQIVDHTTRRALDLMGIVDDETPRWHGRGSFRDRPDTGRGPAAG